jgi:GDP-4-dehydro-6-deoxy-D-mannose reductase
VRVLVTGATGFAGTHLCRGLRDRGDEVMTAASSGDADFRIDVRERDAVFDVVAAAAPERIYHLAGLANVPLAESQAELADAVNRGGTVNVLDAAFPAGVPVLVVSSGAVYGRLPEAELPAREQSPLHPVGVYAASKAAAEAECVRRCGRQRIVIVRPFNHTGAGQSREYVCSDFAAQIAECEAGMRDATVEVGDLASERDFSDVRDVVDAYVAALEHGISGRAYNVCSGRPTSAGRVLEILCALARVKVRVSVRPERLRAGEVTRMFGSHATLTAASGWRPSHALESTLAVLLDDWRARTAGVADKPR